MKKLIRRTLAIALSLSMIFSSFVVLNKTVKADPEVLTVVASVESGQTNRLHVTWTNPAAVVSDAGFTFGYYINSVDTNNQAKASNGWVWSEANPSEIRTMLDNVAGTNGGVNFNDGGDYKVIVVIYQNGEVYAQGESESIHLEEYVETNTDAKFKLDRYEQDGKNTVVSWQTIGGAKTYTVYNKDTGAQLASAGENATWTQWNSPAADAPNQTYTAQLVARDANGDTIAITNDEISLNYYYEIPVVPDEHKNADFSNATWNELEINGTNKDDITAKYYINSEHGLNTFFWGIYAPDEDIPYHSQRTNCIITSPVFAFQWSNISNVWINSQKYLNPSTTFNNQGDCGEISVDVFKPGINVITLVLNDGSLKTFGIKYVPEGFMDVSPYRSSGSYTAPSQTGKVFAGWFKDVTCAEPYTDATGYAYAKFIDESILSTKFQAANDGTAVRMLSSLDSKDYSQVGFKFTGTYDGDELDNWTKTTTKLYKKINADGKEVLPTVFSGDSKFFFTYTVRGLTAGKALTLNVTPFFVTKDGTTVEGKSGNHPQA